MVSPNILFTRWALPFQCVRPVNVTETDRCPHRAPFRNCRGVSLIHVAFVIPLAIRCLDSPALSADRAFGWDERAGTLFAIAAGYFLWDTIDTITHFEAFGFVAHGSCHFTDNRSVARIYQRRSAGTACFFVYFLCFVRLPKVLVKIVADDLPSAHSWLITPSDAYSGRGKSIT